MMDDLRKPADLIQKAMNEMGWSAVDLGTVIGKPLQVVSDLLRGVRPITVETALQLEAALPLTAQELLEAETAFRLSKAREQADITAISGRRRLAQYVPLRAMIKQGWTDGSEADLARFLGVSDVGDYQPGRNGVNFRSKFASESNLAAADLWLRRLEEVSIGHVVSNEVRVDHIFPVLSNLLSEAEGVGRAQAVLADLGVRLVYLPQLPGTKLDGASVNFGFGPVIALTLRFDRIDWFWFTLLHECAHLISGHQGTNIDLLDSSSKDPHEVEADRLAQNALIPPDLYRKFTEQMDGLYTIQRVRSFAERINRHEGIVVGRLQRDERIHYSEMRSSLERVKPFLEGQIVN